MRRGVLGIVVAVSLVGPASALGATRYAAPRGSGAACTAAHPCAIDQAINHAASGDLVILAGNMGSYGTLARPLTTPLEALLPMTVEGAPGQPRPVIYSNAQNDNGATYGLLVGDAVVVRGLEIVGTNGGFLPPTTLEVQSLSKPALVDRVVAKALGSAQTACDLYGAAMVNSVCYAPSGDGILDSTLFGSPQGTVVAGLRNCTIVGGLAGLEVQSNSNASLNIGVTNSIVKGSRGDIRTDTSQGGSVSVTLDHSDYFNVDTSSGGTVTPPVGGTNQPAPPSFVNAAGGNFHEVGGSVTIDGGANSPYNGATDLDGHPRKLGSATDIGAYEFVPVPRLSGFKIQPSAFQTGSHGGAKVSYRDSEAGRARFVVYRRSHGKLHAVGSFTRLDRAGANSFHFSGRLHGKTLPKGHYVLAAASSFYGKQSGVVSVSFRIV